MVELSKADNDSGFDYYISSFKWPPTGCQDDNDTISTCMDSGKATYSLIKSESYIQLKVKKSFNISIPKPMKCFQ